MKHQFPVASFREHFAPRFDDSDMMVMFNDMCELLQGNGDPWEKVHKLRLRFYEFDEEEFDFDDWLINAGYFFLVLKAEIMNGAGVEEIARLASWFQDILDDGKEDLMDDEIPYHVSFSVLAELMKVYPARDGTVLPATCTGVLDDFFTARASMMDNLPPYVREKAVALLVPYLLDMFKLFPASTPFLLGWLDRFLDMLREDKVQADEATGLCVRSLAFESYDTPSPDEQFSWALSRFATIFDPFIQLTCAMNLATGHHLRGEQDAGMALLKNAFIASYRLPSPKKEVHVSFLMRGLVEARGTRASLHEDILAAFDEIVEHVIEEITNLYEFLEASDDPDASLNEIMENLEVAFVILSGVLDNLGMAAVHVKDPRPIDKVDHILETVLEANVSMNFKSKNAVYLFKIDPRKHAARIHDILAFIIELLERDVEAIYLDDVFDFFIEHSKNCLELAFLSGDEAFIDHLDRVFCIIKDRKNLGDEDVDMLRYQTMAALNYLMTMAWNEHHGVVLLQGYSS